MWRPSPRARGEGEIRRMKIRTRPGEGAFRRAQNSLRRPLIPTFSPHAGRRRPQCLRHLGVMTLLLRRHARDQPRAALEGHVVPQPGERHHETVPDLDQEEDVDDAPEQPAEEAAQLQAAELHHRGAPSDGGEIALVAIAERRRRRRAGDACRDQPSHIAAHLLGGGRDARNAAARRIGHGGGVADREHLGEAAHREIRLDLHAPGAVMRGVKPARRRRGDHAGRPDDGGGIDAAALEIDSARVAADHARRGHHLDALPGERALHVF